MSFIAISALVFACVFGVAVFGMLCAPPLRADRGLPPVTPRTAPGHDAPHGVWALGKRTALEAGPGAPGTLRRPRLDAQRPSAEDGPVDGAAPDGRQTAPHEVQERTQTRRERRPWPSGSVGQGSRGGSRGLSGTMACLGTGACCGCGGNVSSALGGTHDDGAGRASVAPGRGDHSGTGMAAATA